MQHIVNAQSHLGRAKQKVDELDAVLQHALSERAGAGAPGDDEEKRALGQQVAALQEQQNTQPQAQDAAGASRAQAKDEVQAEDRPQELEDRCKELKAQLAASKAQAEDRAKELEDRCKELEAQLAASKAQAAAAAAEEEAEDSDTVAQEPVRRERSTLANELRACVCVCQK